MFLTDLSGQSGIIPPLSTCGIGNHIARNTDHVWPLGLRGYRFLESDHR